MLDPNNFNPADIEKILNTPQVVGYEVNDQGIIMVTELKGQREGHLLMPKEVFQAAYRSYVKGDSID